MKLCVSYRERSDSTSHFCRLCAPSAPLLYRKSRYTFRSNWLSSDVQVMCLRKLLFCFSIVIASGNFCWYRAVGNHVFGFVLLACRICFSLVSCSIELFCFCFCWSGKSRRLLCKVETDVRSKNWRHWDRVILSVKGNIAPVVSTCHKGNRTNCILTFQRDWRRNRLLQEPHGVIPEDAILHSRRRENLKSYRDLLLFS
jgi:hypothetical protein